MKLQIAGILFSLLVATGLAAANPPSVLPLPQKMVVGEGSFKLTPDTRIYTDAASRATGEYLAAQLRQSTGYKLKVSASSKAGAVRGAILITMADAKAGLGAEGYELTAAKDSVVIRAPESAGSFYGVQTLLQLLPPEVFAAKPVAGVAWTMPCVQIEDQPRFKWRGMLLDVSRQFFTKEEVKKVLDTLALHKLNMFQWHLTDDHGWRIEIKKYPKLTEVAAWRKDIEFGLDPKSSTAYGPDGRYGGFYTQADIREVVAYATARHITIVPEIEMPAHAAPALGAYPEFQCDRTTNSAPVAFFGAFCVGNDQVFEFLQNVLAEVIELFPGKYIHIGGDEVQKDSWKPCPKCQARIKAEGLKDVNELQSYFIRRIEKFINGQGRVLVGWSEILQGGLAPNATVTDWIGGAEEAASAGHDVVMSPTSACYFDFYQSLDRQLEPKLPAEYLGYLPLSQVYAYEPIPAKLDPKFHSHILGAQGNLWTPYMPSLKQLECMMYPRLSALAEVTWSPKAARNWDDFNRRLQVQFQRFDELGINYWRLGNGQPRLDRSNQPKTAVSIGEWTPVQLTNQALTWLEWDVTPQVTAPGKYRLDLNYTHGAHGINAYFAILREDGVEILRDQQDTFAGLDVSYAVYTFNLRARKAGAKYTIQVGVGAACPGCTDSFGKVLLSLLPEKP